MLLMPILKPIITSFLIPLFVLSFIFQIKKELKTEDGCTIKREPGQGHSNVVVKKERR